MNIAIVGASNNPEKYGNIILLHLRNDGHTVFPVNPKEKIVAGLPAYRKVGDIEAKIDVVDIVVPPKITMKVLRHMRHFGQMDIWIQPGAGSDEVRKYLDRHSKEFGRVTYEECIMTALDRVYRK